jgi:hypothetical protein
MAFIFFSIENYCFAVIAFNHIPQPYTENPSQNPWIPILSGAISLGFAILAFLRERKKK